MEDTGGWSNRLGLICNKILIGMLFSRRRLVECVGRFCVGVCRLLGWSFVLMPLWFLLLTLWLRLPELVLRLPYKLREFKKGLCRLMLLSRVVLAFTIFRFRTSFSELFPHFSGFLAFWLSGLFGFWLSGLST